MAGSPTTSFDLHKLGWKAFEDLTACIFREILGQTLQIFADGPDGGRDAAFHGKWLSTTNESFSGTYVIQCKHTSNPSTALASNIINKELSKIKRLASEGLCDNYIFITNHNISGKIAENLEKTFIKAGAQASKVYGEKWINSIISEQPKLRRLVPRIYGLGDLTQIVTHNAYRQSIKVLDSIAPDLNCFVPTDAYRKSAHALKEHGFVLLIGEPASGKTMIANLLALSAADEWDLQTLMLSSPEEFSQYWNPDDPGQFLWVDDAFGANQYDPGRVHEWNHRLLKLKAAIKQGARAVFTSRDYIYNSAKKDLKISSFDLLEDSRVVIEVEKLSKTERQMILYNHLKCGNQSIDFKKNVKPFLVEVANTPKFLPEIARRFGSPKFTKNLRPYKDPVLNFFKKPKTWLEETLEGLNTSDKAAIALVFISGGCLPTPVPNDPLTIQTLDALGASLGGVKIALPKLDGAFLRFDRENQEWHFRHPTIRDAFATIIGSNPEYINIYLKGVMTEQFIQEVTCGDIGLEGVQIIIPKDFFSSVIEKLRKHEKEMTYKWIDPVKSFLAYRCSSLFLQKYYSGHTDISKLSKEVFSLSSTDKSLRILKQLRGDKLLPEGDRLRVVQQISQITKRKTSLDFLDSNILGELLTAQEKEIQWKELKTFVLEDGEEITESIWDDWDRECDPDLEFYDFRLVLEKIIEEGQEKETEIAEELTEIMNDAISSMEDEQTSQAAYDSLETEDTESVNLTSNRCIFSDIDL